MDQLFLSLVEHLGYVIVFLGVGIESMGVPVPGETTLIAGAFVAAQGHLAPWGVALAGWSGAVLGDNAGFWIGRRWGRRLVQLRGVRRVWDPGRVALAERFFERRGWIAVFGGRFVALLRIFAGPLAGMHGMRWRTFLVANASGGALWVAGVVSLGLVLGNNYDRAVQLVSRAGYIGLGAVALLAAGYVAWRVRRSRRERAEGERLLSERAAQAAGTTRPAPGGAAARSGGEAEG